MLEEEMRQEMIRWNDNTAKSFLERRLVKID